MTISKPEMFIVHNDDAEYISPIEKSNSQTKKNTKHTRNKKKKNYLSKSMQQREKSMQQESIVRQMIYGCGLVFFFLLLYNGNIGNVSFKFSHRRKFIKMRMELGNWFE